MKTKYKVLVAALSGFSFLLCLITALGMTYHADDFWELHLSQLYGLRTPIIRYYQWSGDFSYTFTTAIVKVLPIYLPTILALLIWFIALAGIVYTLKRDILLSLGASAFLITAMILISPSTLETLNGAIVSPNGNTTSFTELMSAQNEMYFWQSALLKHTACVIAFTVVFYLMLRKQPNTKLSLTLIFTTAFFAAGFSEVSVGFLPLILTLGNWKRRIVSLSGAALAWLIIGIAPGNAVREVESLPAGYVPLPKAQMLLFALREIPGFFKEYVNAWPIFVLIVAAVALTAYLYSDGSGGEAETQKDKQALIVLFVALLATVFLAVAPCLIVTGNNIPLRAFVIPQAVFLYVVVAASWIAGKWAKRDILRKSAGYVDGVELLC